MIFCRFPGRAVCRHRRWHLLSLRAKLALVVGIAIGVVAGGAVHRDLKPENRSVQR